MSNTLVPGLVVAHSHRLEDLTAVAVQFITTYPLAPLEDETVLVQSNGIAQWLKIELAKASGIASMMNLTLPARFVWKAYRTLLGDDIPKTSPFDKDRLSWRIMRLLPSLIAKHRDMGGQPFRVLENYLGTAGSGAAELADEFNERKLFQLSGRIADLFDQYQNYRADWLDHWAHGRTILSSEAEPVGADSLWQPLLWQALVNDIGNDLFWTNRAELHRRFVAKAKTLTSPTAGLPKRLVIFGISSLPQQTLEVLDALKGCMQIVLCVHNPCQHYWANIVDGKEALKEALKQASNKRHAVKPGMPEDTPDDALHLHAHPLLASWGKQGRDYIHLLDLYDETLAKQAVFDAVKFEIFDEAPVRNRLQQLQNDVLHLRPLQETRTRWQVDAASGQPDCSIQFHSCHSIQREVEVLHDQLLAAFAEDPSLEPRNIMVMVPDVTAYAPHIDAVFGRFDDNRRIPYTIADQGQRHVQPLLVALEQLLTIEQSRVTQTDVLSLLGVPAIQQALDFTEQELVQLQQWLIEAGARWGLCAEQRAQFGMPAHEPTNSWWFALERMVFGYAMGRPNDEAQPRWQSIEPYHEVGGLSADAVGKLGLFIQLLNSWWRFASSSHGLSEWASAAEMLLARLFKPANDADLLLISRLNGQLVELLAVVEQSGFTAPLTLATFKESWLAGIDQPNLNQRFLAGSVNFATLMPMRAIPFKQIYLLGMSDDAYPRRQAAIDFDLMRSQYRPGDRSRRDDDRYLFLEALLSAREKFSVSWVGRSAQDNSEWPPSVLVAQLRDHLVKGWCPNSLKPKDFLASLTTEHKLQAFHPDYMTAGTGLFTYAREWQAVRSSNAIGNGGQAQPLKPWTAEQGQRLQLNLRSLINFLREPAQPFFNQRLNTYFGSDEQQTHDSETFALDYLQRWQLSSELLTTGVAWMRGQQKTGTFAVLEDLQPLQPAFADVFARLQREGALGVDTISEGIQQQALHLVSLPLLEVSKALTDKQPIADETMLFECKLETGIPMIIEDRATQLFTNAAGEVFQLVVTASKAEAKHRFLPYLRHLLLTAVRTKNAQIGAVTTIAVYREAKDKKKAVQSLPSVSSDQAKVVLEELLAAYAQSLSHPSAVVGELAVDWLDTYWKALNGTLKLGRKKLPAFDADEAATEATARLLNALNGDDELAQKYPYAARIQPDFELLPADSAFATALQRLYAPMIRLENGLTLLCELPALESDEQQGGLK
ncbi:exodeoxyribonuclease V subunit gamma [Alkalimonas sp. MEB108]|uniref:RecBCD enzyme subunit RecC n=1 Tax=Alkalimonas cellulosilytica TaxID=3058395 RepID=A0ABU7J9C8_9GAMM|nr:exodeoxyribonuclease V subunit gamma [Alkalimonas sp. MEB108]MEE2003160.1 exodeoxyribonuclease V subunit gamma [Alkalimonas sp. MEB108]